MEVHSHQLPAHHCLARLAQDVSILSSIKVTRNNGFKGLRSFDMQVEKQVLHVQEKVTIFFFHGSFVNNI